MGIEYSAFNHANKTQVDLGKGPWWVLESIPGLKAAHPLTVADEIFSEWGATTLQDVEYCCWIALHLYGFFRTGRWKAPTTLDDDPLQDIVILPDTGSTWFDYPLVGNRHSSEDTWAVVRNFFTQEDLELILACSRD